MCVCVCRGGDWGTVDVVYIPENPTDHNHDPLLPHTQVTFGWTNTQTQTHTYIKVMNLGIIQIGRAHV